MKAFLFGLDQQLADALFASKGWPRLSFDRCIGILDEQKNIVGVVLFQNWNTANVDFSYWGDGSLTLGLARGLAQFVLQEFDCSRVTTMVPKKRKRHLKTCLKFGFVYEGVQRCYYGKEDCIRNTGVRLVMFRDRVEKLARLDRQQAA